MAYDCSTDWTALPAEEPPEHLRDYNNRIFHAPSFKFQFWDDITVTKQLVLIADGDIVIEGSFFLHSAPAPLLPFPPEEPLQLAIVSLGGKVIVAKTGSIGMHFGARAGQDHTDRVGPFDATGGRGNNGGRVLISAPEIEIYGHVHGQLAGGGGDAIADAQTASSDLIERLWTFIRTPFLRPAQAQGGDGGRGGDVLLCAGRRIYVADGARVAGGGGGFAGQAKALAGRGGQARARNGKAGRGGDVVIKGTGPGVTLTVDGIVEGGFGGLFIPERRATANGGVGVNLSGGDASAIGGHGGRGGDVELIDVTVDRKFVIIGGPGGNGSDAEAVGGVGGTWPFAPAFGYQFGQGAAGGNATAVGGDGGAAGNASSPGVSGYPGSGGSATSTGGTGGAALPAASSAPGGQSGSSEAIGGPNGRGAGHPSGVGFRPVPPTGGAGGTATTARQAGVP